MISKHRFKKEIQNITKQLIRKYNPEKVVLFGSLARDGGEIHDIDLFIIKKNPPLLGVERIRELDKLIKYKIATDFIVYTPEEVKTRLEMEDPFVKSILKDGMTLYEKE